MENRAEMQWGKQIAFRQMDGQPVVDLRDGKGAVVIVERIQPDAPSTFDTGMRDALYLEFASAPPLGETLDARRALRAAAYQCGGIMLLYESNTFEGTVSISRWEEGVGVAGSCDLSFCSPLVDVTGAGELGLEREFDVPAQATPAGGAAPGSAEGAAGPEATPGQPPAARYCDQCGQPVVPGNRFCTNCGRRLERL